MAPRTSLPPPAGEVGRAGYIVTFDRAHLLVLDPFRGVRIVLPGTMLELLREG